ncbi:MAG: porin family protein [Pricia sp.]
MKKYVIFATFSMFAVTLSAQTWSDSFQLGARAGLNFATVSGDDYDSPDARTSFFAGLVAEAPITDRFSLQPEVFYSGQGFDITDDPNQPDAEFQLGYIQVPVLLKLYLIEGLNLHAGPQFGFKVSEEVDTQPFEGEGDFETDSIKTFDFQLTGGLEYKLLGSFFVQGRYSYGFSELIDNIDGHNSVLSLGVGFMF